MKVNNIDIPEIIKKANRELKEDKNISSSLKATFEIILIVLKILCDRLSLNSNNSSIPPSKDPNRDKKNKKIRKDKGKKRKPGGQKGHPGSTLEQVDNPTEIEFIEIDRRTIPIGDYRNIGVEKRQVFDLNINLNIKEYQAQILEDSNGNQYVANFPEGVTKSAQYGNTVKSQAVYMSIFQLIPLARILDYFKEQVGLLISKGSISNFRKLAYTKLQEIGFKSWVSIKLLASELNHADETGINVNGKRIWLHCLSNDKYVLYHPDLKRGKEAMDRMGILPKYGGFLCHDHWKPYYKYDDCTHALCNAHHLRELERAYEQDDQSWARNMSNLLNEINNFMIESNLDVLPEEKIKSYQKRYRSILTKGKKECPLPEINLEEKGRIKKSKSRNLLERLIDFENDTLRFMREPLVPFTNNQGENDIRMTKVQQKISGCFRNMEGAEEFSLIRSYIMTARKNGVSATEAIRDLLNGKIPSFMSEK